MIVIFGIVADRVGEQHLRAVADDAAALLLDAGQEARHVDQGHQRDVEDVAEADEARALVGRVDVERAGLLHRLVGDDADHDALDAREADDEVAREQPACTSRKSPSSTSRRMIACTSIGSDGIGLGSRSFIASSSYSSTSALELVRRILGVVGRQVS